MNKIKGDTSSVVDNAATPGPKNKVKFNESDTNVLIKSMNESGLNSYDEQKFRLNLMAGGNTIASDMSPDVR
jgi:hypothetical protein